MPRFQTLQRKQPRQHARAFQTARPLAPGAILGGLPARLAPQLATNAEEPPPGDAWISEIKLDGYRLLVWIDHGRVRLVTRNGHDWTPRMPRLAARFAALDVETALLDGEMVALRPDGTSHFHDLQAALSAGADDHLFFYAFDLLHLNGWDLRACALRDRKQLIEAVQVWNNAIRYAAHIDGNAAGLHREAARFKLEGIIAKRADAPYRAGRSAAWLKIKCLGREDLVVLGWTLPGGSRHGIGALVVGFYEPSGDLHYAGQVGTGFSDKELLALRAQLEAMPSAPPVALLVAGEEPDRSIRWVAPSLVAEVNFTAWSGEGRVRHPVYLGLREDKAASEVVMAVPDSEAPRRAVKPAGPVIGATATQSRWKGAIPPLRLASR
jgi:bifunctional non-homologous end joining protein LigD